jgi:allantoinase
MGFKAFMCPSGIDEFPASDSVTLREGMMRIAALGSILLVHAEDPARLLEPHGTGPFDFIRSRPPEAERSAIESAVDLADATGCPLHVVHVSTTRGMELIREAQQKGLDVSGETCPHYLLYVEADLQRLGGTAKCAPPFRTALDREALWTAPMIVSDHSPSTLDLKKGDDFVKIWGGISGCQSTRQLLLGQDRLELVEVAAVTSDNIARRFDLEGKGMIATGYDADLWLVDLSHEGVVRKEDLLYRNQFSAHEGQPIRGRTIRTLVRGNTVFADGKRAMNPTGRFVRPSRGGEPQR